MQLANSLAEPLPPTEHEFIIRITEHEFIITITKHEFIIRIEAIRVCYAKATGSDTWDSHSGNLGGKYPQPCYVQEDEEIETSALFYERPFNC